GGAHGLQPGRHLGGQLLTAVGGQGVVNVQHQGGDPFPGQKSRGDVGHILEHILGGNQHRGVSFGRVLNKNGRTPQQGSPTSALATQRSIKTVGKAFVTCTCACGPLQTSSCA